MNLAFWSDMGSRRSMLHSQPFDDGAAPTTSPDESCWVDQEATLDDPMLARLMAYWRNNCRGATMPPVLAIDPFALRFALGYLVLLEPMHDGADFKVRVYGTQLANRVGYDLTGKLLSAIEDPHMRRVTEQSAARVLFGSRPLLLQRRRLAYRSTDYACLFLPFGDATPGRIIIGISYAE